MDSKTDNQTEIEKLLLRVRGLELVIERATRQKKELLGLLKTLEKGGSNEELE